MLVRCILVVQALSALLLPTAIASAEPVAVRYREGSLHGYLALRSLDGKLLGAGDLVQTMHGDRLTARLTYHFKDGSIDDETAVFTQKGYFRVVTDRRVQKGPSFPKPMDVTIKAQTGEVTVRYSEDGKEKVNTSHLDLPDDLANGILLNMVRNLPIQDGEAKVSFLAATPKPQIVHLSIKHDGTETFRVAGVPNQALRLKIHVELGGLMGVVAPVIGKEPADSYVWISTRQVPAFMKSETPLFLGGPQLRTELANPVW